MEVVLDDANLATPNADLTRLGELLDLAPVGVIVRNLDADTIIYWSRGAAEMYGWRREEALGRVTHALLETQFPVSKEDIDDTLRRTGRWEGELVHRLRNGDHIVVASRQAVQRGKDGRPEATLEINTDITRGKRMEEGLRESEDRFRLLVDSVQDYAIFLLSPEGQVASWNAGAQRLKGYRREEILGQSFTRFYTPEDIAQGLPATLLALAESEGRAEAEGWRVRKDGSRFWADVVLTALRGERGELRGFAKVTRDLTDRRQAEDARANASREEGARAASETAQAELRTSRDQLAAILAGVADGITVQDVSGHLVFANDVAARLCGFSSARELLAVPPQDILSRFHIFDESGAPLPPDRLPGRLAFQGRASDETLVRFKVLATGEERWSLLSATPIANIQGQVGLSVTIFRDITERKRAEETARFMAAASAELAASLEFEPTLRRIAQLAVPALADWCVVDVLGDDGRIRRVAAAHVDPAKAQLAWEVSERYPEDPSGPSGVARAIRTGRSELMAKISSEQLQAGARDAEQLDLLRSLQLQSVIIVPLVARGRTLGAITLVAAESGRRYGAHDLALAEDLAVRAALAADNAQLYRAAQEQAAIQVKLNSALRDTMAQLQQALLTRDEFLAAASHDLKNPVASIKAAAQLLRRRIVRSGIADLAQLQAGLERIDVIATRAAGQLDELLDIARLQMDRPLELDLRPTDLVTLAREIIAEHQQRTDRHRIELRAELAELVGMWDMQRLCRVVGNLLDNAIKYSPDGGLIRVHVGIDREAEAWAVLAVEDQGVGIPQDELERVFGRFQRGTNVIGQIPGSGIGLASARQIVESHGGALMANSRTGEGATFTIRLPIGQANTAERPFWARAGPVVS